MISWSKSYIIQYKVHIVNSINGDVKTDINTYSERINLSDTI